MAFTQQDRHRTYLLCPICKKTQFSLPGHLRKKCMKDASVDNIAKTVESAKVEGMKLLRQGRIWEYSQIRLIMDNPDPIGSMIKELQERGNVVMNIPQTDPSPATSTLTSADSDAGPSADPCEGPSAVHSPGSGGSSKSSGELYQCPATEAQTTSLREKMSQAGCYKKHSIDHPLLMSFARYLENDLANENFKQEVENVARFLFFMDHREPNLLFVRENERTRDYFGKLTGIGLSMQTVQNYIKSVKRFLKFHVSCTDLRFTDRELHKDCADYLMFLSHIQASTSKQVSKEVTRKRFDILTEGCIPPHQCLAVLEAAKGDFLSVVGKLSVPQSIGEKMPSMAELQLVLYYLEAVLILRHLQRPGVVEHMTVEEWMLRRRVPEHGGYVVVGVKEHKTTATQVASFALSQEEEMWFEVYYTEVRPLFLTKKRKRVSDEDDEDSGKEKFFLSSAGKPVYNSSNDLSRLHDKYKLPKVTSQMARRSFETSTKSLTDGDKSMVADYLTHSSVVSANNVVSALLILKRLGSASGGEDTSVRTAGCSYLDDQAAYDLLVQKYPVRMHGGPPKRAERTALTKTHERYCYDRWRSEQLQLRVQHVLEHFGRRQPSEARVHRWVEKQGWTVNLPDAAQVVRRWKPSGAVQVDAAVTSQRTPIVATTPTPNSCNITRSQSPAY